MPTVSDVASNLSSTLAKYERKPERMRALLGDTKGVVQVVGRAGYVHIHLENGQYFGVAFNAISPLENNLPVIVGYSHGQPELFQVIEAGTGGTIAGFVTGAAGSYTNANITVDAGGHVIAASDGVSSGASVVAIISLIGQTADIAKTAFPNTDVPGMYRLNLYLVTTTADAGTGEVTVIFSFTDEAKAQTFVIAHIDLSVLGSYVAPLSLSLYLASGSISYETVHTGSYGSAVYSLRVVVERMA